VIFRKEIVESLGGYSESNKHWKCEDLELWFRYYSKGYLGYNIQKPLIYYREGYLDYKRRKVKESIATFKTMVDGYRLNNIPIHLYPLAVKPILSAMVPRKVILGYHNIRLKRQVHKQV
jgi:glycosyltransferase EpsE